MASSTVCVLTVFSSLPSPAAPPSGSPSTCAAVARRDPNGGCKQARAGSSRALSSCPRTLSAAAPLVHGHSQEFRARLPKPKTGRRLEREGVVALAGFEPALSWL